MQHKKTKIRQKNISAQKKSPKSKSLQKKELLEDQAVFRIVCSWYQQTQHFVSDEA